MSRESYKALHAKWPRADWQGGGEHQEGEITSTTDSHLQVKLGESSEGRENRAALNKAAHFKTSSFSGS
jgi:hypothetical protein